MQWRHKDLLDVTQLSSPDVEHVFSLAASFLDAAAGPTEQIPSLEGRRVALLFAEPTARTKASFETAVERLGADMAAPTASGSLRDVARSLQEMAPDAVVVRHGRSGAAAFLAKKLECPVINAGDGWHAHPTRALLDAFTLRREWGKLAGRTLLIVGDVAHSGAARSAIRLFSRLGTRIRLCAPRTLLPTRTDTLPVTVYPDLDKAVRGVDAVMCLPLAPEHVAAGLLPELREYAERWGLGRRHLERAKPGARVLHPGPLVRGMEITPRLADAGQNLILDQEAAGVAVRMALLVLYLTRKESGHVRD